ncbi:uncharacterized protein LOC125532477 isoform X3 [Triticum urartu]|uniref:uncharacterized protein LOC125532477 isoform X3 n=1 Tax=Triticum urartu TaxID=4572 RepID=UPI0020444462|nr:uncharacterized protein LOC125532477 isoform X3 [Triticum urartu]
MYAQLPPEASEHLKDVLEEGKVSLMKFMCNQLESSFRTVESPYMIQFTRYSTAVPQPGLEDAYPYCTYNLLPFPDVIGQITALSDIIPVQSMYQPQPSDTRTIILTDLMGNEIKILLWGARAHEFAAEDVRAASIESAVVAIFVGTLPKMSQGVKLLSGSSACRWYINEDLPEINAFHSSLGKEVAPVAVYAPIDQGIGASICEPPVEMTFKQLLALDPLDNLFHFCRASLSFVRSPSRVWALISVGGSSRALPAIRLRMLMGLGSVAQTKVALPLGESRHILSAHLQLMDQLRLNSMFFERAGRTAIGKPLLTLLRQKYPGYSLFRGSRPCADRRS